MTGRLILLRHGETYSNVARRLDTRPPGAELTENGRQQATAVGEELATVIRELGCWGTSVALRAQQTAVRAVSAFESARGLPEFSIPIEILPDIHEMQVGEWEMRSDDEAYQGYREVMHRNLAGETALCPEGGESLDDVVARYQPVVEKLVAAHPDKDVVLVSHGGVIRVMGAVAAANIDGDFAFDNRIENCRYVILWPEGRPFGQWIAERWGDTELA